jgi:hypothetical protein
MIKKVLVSLCVLPLLLTACSKDEVIAPVADSGKAISFGTVLAPASRGAVVDKTALQVSTNGFTVVAYDQGDVVTSWNDYLSGLTPANELPATPNFMNNTKVTWDTALDPDAWTYTPVKFWPGLTTSGTQYGHVTFFAFGGLPSAGKDFTFTATNNYPKLAYETPAAAADQADLVADVLFDRYWGHADGNPVKFQFEHILSKIGFQAKLADTYSGAEVKVTSLKVKYGSAVVKGADYKFNTDSDTPAGKGSWLTTGATNFAGSEVSGELVATAGVVVNSTSVPVQLNEAGKFLMLIPQELSNNGDLTVELEYEVTANSKTDKYEGSYAIPAIEYAIGTAYTYTFNIVLRTVVFDADIDVNPNWGAGSTGSDLTIQ